MNALLLLSLALLPSAAPETEVAAQQWGDLSGQFVYDGKPPAAKEVPAGRPGVKVVDESLVVDAKTGGIANVVIFLRDTSDRPAAPIFPEYDTAAAKDSEVVLKVTAAAFEPHVVLLRSPQALVVKNEAGFGINLKCDPLRNAAQQLLLINGQSGKFTFPRADVLPIKLGSNIHPWYGGYVVVQKHPYTAKTDATGHFTIKNLPTGKWSFQVWHEQNGYVKEVFRKSKVEKWPRGKLEVDIQPGENNLGEIAFLNAKSFGP